ILASLLLLESIGATASGPAEQFKEVEKLVGFTHRLGERLGFRVTTTPIGFKWIKGEFLKGDVSLGGEESGGIGFPEHLPERDGILASLLLLESIGATASGPAEQFKEVEKLVGFTH
ncbi:hypothetical protein, partial [Streptococcus pneumoniae]|uniref:hypothetical protein n=1 Tax=Streptococcus pneumoniae TaxID=1313 RepID=UPI0012579175